MDRNSVVGTLLIILITISFFVYQSKNQTEVIESPSTTEVIEEKQSVPPSASNIVENYIDSNTAVQANEEINKAARKLGAFSNNGINDEIITIENDKLIVHLNSKGGKIESVELKGYKTFDQKPLILSSPDRQKRGFIFPQNNAPPINSNDLNFEVIGSSFSVEGEEEKQIKFRASAGDGKYFEQVYGLKGNSYLLNYDVNFVNLQGVIPNNTSYIEHFWTADLQPFEKEITTERRYSSVYYKYKGDDVESLNLNKNDEEDVDAIEWISFKQHFFNSTLFFERGFDNSTLKVAVDDKDTTTLKSYSASLRLPYTANGNQSYDMHYYLGPNSYRTLKKMGNDLEELVQLSPDFFVFRWMSLVSKAIIIPIFNLLERYISSYGIIILILTLIIKMALFPLTFKSYKSAAAMRVLKPEIDALKEKFGDDQQKLGTEQMKLYSTAGVNPLGGCLPMVLQMPILLAMYYFFPSSIELRQESFLWATDLSTYDTILNLPFTIPMYGSHVSLFTLLMFVSSILYASVQPQMSTGGPGAAQMKMMQYVFPIFLLVLFNSWPAGLTYYYFLSNIITYLQSWAAKKFFIDEDKLREKIQKNKQKPKKKSKWQQRLEDIQKQQQNVKKQKSKPKAKSKK